MSASAPTRDALCVVLDVSHALTQQQLEQGKKIVSGLVQQKMLYTSQDIVALLFAGSDESANRLHEAAAEQQGEATRHYRHISVIKPFQKPDVDYLKRIDAQARPARRGVCDVFDTIITAIDLFEDQLAGKRFQRRILFVTAAAGGVRDKQLLPSIIDALKAKFISLVVVGIDFDATLFARPEEQFAIAAGAGDDDEEINNDDDEGADPLAALGGASAGRSNKAATGRSLGALQPDDDGIDRGELRQLKQEARRNAEEDLQNKANAKKNNACDRRHGGAVISLRQPWLQHHAASLAAKKKEEERIRRRLSRGGGGGAEDADKNEDDDEDEEEEEEDDWTLLPVKAQNERILKLICEDVGYNESPKGESNEAVVIRSEDAEHDIVGELTKRRVGQRPMGKLAFELHPNLTIPVCIFTRTQLATKPPMTATGPDGEAVRTITRHFPLRAPDTEIKPEERIKAMHYGKSIIPLNEVDQKQFLNTGTNTGVPAAAPALPAVAARKAQENDDVDEGASGGGGGGAGVQPVQVFSIARNRTAVQQQQQKEEDDRDEMQQPMPPVQQQQQQPAAPVAADAGRKRANINNATSNDLPATADIRKTPWRRGLALMACVARGELEPFRFMGACKAICPCPGDEVGARILSAFTHALRTTDKAMILRYVWRDRSDPQLCAALPYVDAHSGEECLEMVSLPFFEDQRELIFHSFHEASAAARPNAVEKLAVQQMVRDMMPNPARDGGDLELFFDPHNVFNPVIQMHNHMLRVKLLNDCVIPAAPTTGADAAQNHVSVKKEAPDMFDGGENSSSNNNNSGARSASSAAAAAAAAVVDDGSSDRILVTIRGRLLDLSPDQWTLPAPLRQRSADWGAEGNVLRPLLQRSAAARHRVREIFPSAAQVGISAADSRRGGKRGRRGAGAGDGTYWFQRAPGKVHRYDNAGGGGGLSSTSATTWASTGRVGPDGVTEYGSTSSGNAMRSGSGAAFPGYGGGSNNSADGAHRSNASNQSSNQNNSSSNVAAVGTPALVGSDVAGEQVTTTDPAGSFLAIVRRNVSFAARERAVFELQQVLLHLLRQGPKYFDRVAKGLRAFRQQCIEDGEPRQFNQWLAGQLRAVAVAAMCDSNGGAGGAPPLSFWDRYVMRGGDGDPVLMPICSDECEESDLPPHKARSFLDNSAPTELLERTSLLSEDNEGAEDYDMLE